MPQTKESRARSKSRKAEYKLKAAKEKGLTGVYLSANKLKVAGLSDAVIAQVLGAAHEPLR